MNIRGIGALSLITLMLLAVLLARAGTVSAQDLKARMAARLPVIAELKQQGIVGESNRGFLEFIGSRQAREDVVAAENRDRQTVYEAIAAREGTTADLVGRRRALQLADLARPGEWLQDKNGNWYRK